MRQQPILTNRGFAVHLFSRSRATLQPLLDRGGLELTGVVGDGFFAKILAPHLRKRQILFFNPRQHPRCGKTMRVIAVIERPAVVRRVLDHLGLSCVPPSLRAPPDPPGGQVADRPREWPYEPFFDALPVADPVME